MSFLCHSYMTQTSLGPTAPMWVTMRFSCSFPNTVQNLASALEIDLVLSLPEHSSTVDLNIPLVPDSVCRSLECHHSSLRMLPGASTRAERHLGLFRERRSSVKEASSRRGVQRGAPKDSQEVRFWQNSNFRHS